MASAPMLFQPGYAVTFLPLTHFLRIVRGILLKGNSFAEVWPNIWPILVFTLAAIGLGVYRKTLD